MKRDWTKPQMRLSVEGYCNDFLCFLLFLRLALVVFLCVPIVLVITKSYGPGIGLICCISAYPLWWYHFGLPRFKEQGSGFFSPRFCLWGYIAMTVSFLVILLEYFGILKEGEPNPHLHKASPYLRTAIMVGFAIFSVYALARHRKPKDGA